MSNCIIDLCCKPVKSRGYCHSHYMMVWYKQNHPDKYNANRLKQRHTIQHRFTAYKGKPDIKGRWFLTIEQFAQAIKPACYYCHGFFGKTTTGSGLDRVDNTKGYTVDNVVSCCHFCNRIKQDLLTAEENKEVIKLIKKLRSSKVEG